MSHKIDSSKTYTRQTKDVNQKTKMRHSLQISDKESSRASETENQRNIRLADNKQRRVVES